MQRQPDDDESPQPTAEHPTVWMEPDEVESTEFQYSIRAPGDWVVSGTLPGGHGPGRHFHSWREAEKWAREKYNTRLKGRLPEADFAGNPRWAFIIRR